MGESKKACGQASSFNNIRLVRDYPQSKDIKSPVQKKRIFHAWSGPPKTMLEISVITGIERASVCWFAKEFRHNNSIKLIYTGTCSISMHRAGRYSTNPKYWNHAKEKEVSRV